MYVLTYFLFFGEGIEKDVEQSLNIVVKNPQYQVISQQKDFYQ